MPREGTKQFYGVIMQCHHQFTFTMTYNFSVSFNISVELKNKKKIE